MRFLDICECTSSMEIRVNVDETDSRLFTISCFERDSKGREDSEKFSIASNRPSNRHPIVIGVVIQRL